MELIEQKLKTLTSYHGVIVNVRLDEARLPDGSTAKREVVEHPGGVTVLPLEPDGTVWCVRQYRYPFSRTLLEVPAGKLEPGEAPELAAARELSEETGLTAGRMQYLGANFTSPGYSEEVLHIYLARDLHRGAAHLDPGEFLNVERHPLEELVQMALDGELCDGKNDSCPAENAAFARARARRGGKWRVVIAFREKACYNSSLGSAKIGQATHGAYSPGHRCGAALCFRSMRGVK